MDRVRNSSALISNLCLGCTRQSKWWLIKFYPFIKIRESMSELSHFTYVTRTFPWRLMVDRPCSVPRARLMTWGFGVGSTFNGAFCLLTVGLRRNIVCLCGCCWCWCGCWPCLNLWFVDGFITAPPWWTLTFPCDLPATEHSFDWFDSTQSVRAFASLSLAPPWLRPKRLPEKIQQFCI